MKRIFQHPPKRETGRKYWRSLEEFSDSEEFHGWLEREFPAGAAEVEMDGVSRRNFMKLMGASMALAGFGMSGCRRPEAYLTAYAQSTEWQVPGKALFYATSMPSRKGAIPLVATTYDGRPTKLEGNPLVPGHSGKTDAFAQASVLDVWDPDRAREFKRDGKRVESDEFFAHLDERLARLETNGGSGLAFLLDEVNSPTRSRLRAEVAARFPLARFCIYEPAGNDSQRVAVEKLYGEGLRWRPRFENAAVIFSLGSDFLGVEDGTLEMAKAFADGRRVHTPQDEMNRLYVVENRFTLTGGMAEHRLRCPASQLTAFAVALAREVVAAAPNSALQAMLAAVGDVPGTDQFDATWVREAAADLVAHRRRALVIAGERQPAHVQALAFALNEALGSMGATVDLIPTPVEKRISINELAQAARTGQISTLINMVNVAYNAPADVEIVDALKSIDEVIYLAQQEDETAEFADWQIPAAHYLESWSDALTANGTLLPVQPMILPLYDGISINDLLARAAGIEAADGFEHVQTTFQGMLPGADNAAWTAFLRDGFATASRPEPVTRSVNTGAVSSLIAESGYLPALIPAETLEVVFVTDNKVDDGRYANNGWLQELPEQITKLTWDNAAWISLATAEKLGVTSTDVDIKKKGSDVVSIEVNGRTLEIPVLLAPGHADNSITISLGYGREKAGIVGTGIGFNAYKIRTTANPLFAFAKLTQLGRRHELAVTHGHWTMEERDPVREGTLEKFRNEPAFPYTIGMDSHIPPDISLYKTPPLTAAEQWAMSIDLNSCTGCSACVVACQAENNIPIVGKEQVINQREMHWMRIDRYFSTVEDNIVEPEMVMQPLTCQHCENAPCETVCPVNATVHSEDGLNVMAYNRCIGTRYCANNCPYKVRRFNYFDYNKRDIHGTFKPPLLSERSNLYKGPFGPSGMSESLKFSKNPNVTVRMRGVIEKCTFCVQRIQEGRIATKVRAGASADVRMPTDLVKTACQQACPTEAIVFGDKNDPESAVSKLLALDHNYQLLRYLNVRPRIHYLARLRNPNMAMPGADKIGHINTEMHHEEHHDEHAEEHAEEHSDETPHS